MATQTPTSQTGRTAGIVSIVSSGLGIVLTLVPFVTSVLSIIGLIASLTQFRTVITTKDDTQVLAGRKWKNVAIQARIGLILSIIAFLLSPIGILIGVLALTLGN